jgi:hypothetical protein
MGTSILGTHSSLLALPKSTVCTDPCPTYDHAQVLGRTLPRANSPMPTSYDDPSDARIIFWAFSSLAFLNSGLF